MLPSYGQSIVRSDPQTFPDNIKLFFGDDNDASIYYDGTDLIINPKEFGSGIVRIEGDVAIGDGNVAAVGTIRLPNASNIQFRNAANDGDVEAIQVDGSDNVIIGNTANGDTLYRTEGGFVHNFDQTIQITVGSLNLNNQGEILNVASPNSDWRSTFLAVNNTNIGGTMSITVANADNTNAASDGVLIVRVGGASGGDPKLRFGIDGVVSMTMGLDNTTDDFVVSEGNNLGTTDRLRLARSTGVLSVDGSGAGDALPTLFDEYDDPKELRIFQLANVPLSMITREQQLENQKRLVEIGVADWAIQEDGSYHWMMRLQPLTRLLAGGVVQNRILMDHQYKDLDRRLKRIGV